MSVLKTNRTSSTERRARRTRSKLASSSRPRLVVTRSNRFISVQLIDGGSTLATASSRGTGLTGKTAAEGVGKAIAEKVMALNITDVVFDRGALSYEGNVKALADAARAGGLNF